MKRLVSDDSGAVMVYVGLMAAVLVGFGTLAVDVGRATTSHTQLQAAADAAALAGAAQLNRQPDALQRARAAAAQAVTNAVNFAEGGNGAIVLNAAATCTGARPQGGDNCVRFLRSLPASDADPSIADTHVTTDPTLARFVEVRLPTTTRPLFAGLVGAGDAVQPVARAVAGHDRLACEMPPLFMCNPTEDMPGVSLIGQQFQIVDGAGYQPGNFGLLCPPSEPNCGANTIRDLLAASSDLGCHNAYGLTTKPGQSTGMARAGLDVRFDIYRQQASSMRNDARYPPAVNVTHGRTGTCTGNRNNALAPLTRDTAWNGRVGNGSWPVEDYFAHYHGTSDFLSRMRSLDPSLPASYRPTRYEVYRWEIESGNIPERAECFTPGVDDDDGIAFFPDRIIDDRMMVDRRVMPVAMLNCNAANNLNGRSTFIPDGFMLMFLTEPYVAGGGGQSARIYVEFMEPTDGLLQELFRDVTQIYRR